MPHGIPHSIFLGRPMPAPGEPMWLPEDLAKVFEWQRYERSLCKKCRTREWDWKDENGNMLSSRTQRKPTYEFDTRRCFGCQDFITNWELVVKLIGEDKAQLHGLDPVFLPFGTKAQRALDDADDW